MPGNVTMHEPRARIVGDEGKDKPATGRQHGDITTARVNVVEGVGTAVGTIPLAEDVEVMTM